MVKAVPPWVIAQLESWKVIIEAIEEQLGKIEAELRAAAPGKLIFGEGELTHELLARELIDPQRFGNSPQVGNYFGLCPSESTSDQRRAMGSITKHGNPRLRRLMVEMAWRVTRFPPNYRGLGRRAGKRCWPIAKPVPLPARSHCRPGARLGGPLQLKQQITGAEQLKDA